jgi:hypothetical protein
VRLVGRAWLAGAVTALALGMAQSLADPVVGHAAFSGRPSQEEVEPSSGAFAGSFVLERGRGALAPLALVGQGWGMQYRDDELEVAQGIATLGLRGALHPGLWLQGGLGAAVVGTSVEPNLGVEPLIVPAAMLGVGVAFGPLELTAHAGSGVDERGAMRVWHASIGIGTRWQ